MNNSIIILKFAANVRKFTADTKNIFMI